MSDHVWWWFAGWSVLISALIHAPQFGAMMLLSVLFAVGYAWRLYARVMTSPLSIAQRKHAELMRTCYALFADIDCEVVLISVWPHDPIHLAITWKHPTRGLLHAAVRCDAENRPVTRGQIDTFLATLPVASEIPIYITAASGIDPQAVAYATSHRTLLLAAAAIPALFARYREAQPSDTP